MTTRNTLRVLEGQRGPTTGMLEDEDPVLASARRVAQDAEQVARARADGFEGREMQRLTDRLWAYGVTALNSWMRAGTITKKVRASDWRLASFSLEGGRQQLYDQDTRFALAVEAVLLALPEFVDVALREQRWNPHHGEKFAEKREKDDPPEGPRLSRSGTASLTTYFTNPLLYAFVDVYQRWWNGERDARLQRVNVAGYTRLLESAQLFVDPYDEVLVRDALQRVLHEVATDNETRLCALLFAYDWDFARASREHGIPRRAFDDALQRLKKRVQRLVDEGDRTAALAQRAVRARERRAAA
ncbi:hypothetical protein ACFV8Z_52100 [Streptomyces sp. NPDC059837]|uniref:hypothetical protein n=1 Tax=Streptomyces sp. NPDC059837 TaxID=3346968 RepID=UPI003647D1C7